MPADQHMPDKTFEHLRVRPRTAPLCYSRQPTSDGIDQARIDAQDSTVLTVLSAVTCAATFLVVYGGWGF
jgi:hypothetical protein